MLLRIDVNAANRIPKALPEIQRLLARKARVILVAHAGRPQGIQRKYSLAPLATAMGRVLGVPVLLAKDVVGPSAKAMAAALQPGQVMMLENVRFDPREEKNSAAFAKQLAALADVYVNDAFGVCHRAHASVAAITRYLPSFAGNLLVKEVTELAKPRKHPFILVVGGIKIETKVPLLAHLGKEANVILLGSGLYPVLADAHLPPAIIKKIVPMLDARKDVRGRVIDIGPKTERVFLAAFEGAKTIVWNGPLGITEQHAGATGTRVLAKAIAASSAYSIVGGGETVDYIEAHDMADDFGFLSTGGGAMLSFLGGEVMPGIAALY